MGGIIFVAINVFFPTLDVFGKSPSSQKAPRVLSQTPLPIPTPQVNLIKGTGTMVTQNARRTTPVGLGLPMRLKIPRINVSAPVEYVGLTAGGDMGIPAGHSGVAWFNLGPHPGAKGSAVIAGHFGWKEGIPAVFDNLDKLQKGDKLYVLDDKGATSTFVVTGTRIFGEHDDASVVFASSDGKAHLNLVTCQGVWNKNKASYSSRLVVFTDKVTE